MFHWPVVSAVFGVAANFFFFAVVAIFSWFAYVFRSNDESVSQSRKSKLSGEIPAGIRQLSLLLPSYIKVKNVKGV